MIGHWPLSEDSGTTAYDYSGGENHGTANGAGPSGTGTVAGPLGSSAYDFDGTDDDIDVPDLGIDTNTFTTTLWGYSDDYSLSQGFFSLRQESYYQVDVRNGELIYYDSNNYTTLESNPTAGQWYFIAVTYKSASDEWVSYLDGEKIESHTQTLGTQSNEGNVIGDSARDSGNYLDGAIADVRVYDRALSPSEVAYLYEVSQKAHAVTDTRKL